MNITRLQHATQVIEEGGARLVIDPGVFTTLPDDLSDIAGVVVTHEHGDHCAPDLIEAVLVSNPGIRIYGPQGVADAFPSLDVSVVRHDDRVTVGPFGLQFLGGVHAEIHESIPLVDNLGVLVDDSFYYGGDALFVPMQDIDVLAVPASGPWLKLGEAMDYVLAIEPQRTFLVHDMVNSSFGNTMANTRIRWATEQAGGQLIDLDVGESLDV
jgi:L-ascorbate metabolism protein UlaG (beta-lactamase superfamily)